MLAGVVAGFGGLATSYLAASVLRVRSSPVVAVADLVIDATPGRVVEGAISAVGSWDKPLLLLGILVLLGVLFGVAGRLARGAWWAPAVVFVGLAACGAFAVLRLRGSGVVDVLPVVVGFVTWMVALSVLTEPLRRVAALPEDAADGGEATTDNLRRSSRRTFTLTAGTLAGVTVVLAGLGRVIGAGRREVEAVRRLLRLDATAPRVPAGSVLPDATGITPWMTSAEDFYLIHTEFTVPAIEPKDWSLRIHGMVENEIVLSFEDLVSRELTEAWVTLNCVSNPVGGDLIGNAWWSGTRAADLLAEAGPLPGADAVLQTSHDGWTCATPLSALTDVRDAMLVVAMNGKPLPIEHGFPVRTLVPGLYGYVSACKWVVDWEVTRFGDVEAFWTSKGWGEQGPVKMASRIDVPREGESVATGSLRVGGVAWAQHTGISRVEVALDGGGWAPAEIAAPPTNDTWVQWSATVEVGEGEHELRVRAVDKSGEVQTSVVRDVLPDGATGLHRVRFGAA